MRFCERRIRATLANASPSIVGALSMAVPLVLVIFILLVAVFLVRPLSCLKLSSMWFSALASRFISLMLSGRDVARALRHRRSFRRSRLLANYR